MTTAAERCPTPPPDFATRPLPLITVDFAARPLYRVHRNIHGPVYFNKPSVSTTRYRFDAPAGTSGAAEFGVLYGGFSLASCVFETIVRDRFASVSAPLLIEAQEFDERSITRVVAEPARPLRLADFTQSLAPFGGSTLVMAVNDYEGPNLWSQAVYGHVERLDGIYFHSRYSGEPCVAIYDCVGIAQSGGPVPVLYSPGIDDFLTKYQIALV